MLLILIYLSFFCCEFGKTAHFVSSAGPRVKSTVGAVWPKPQKQTTSDNIFLVDTKNFKFQVIKEDCNLLQDAIERYSKLISNVNKIVRTNFNPGNTTNNKNILGNLAKVNIILQKKCDVLPYIGMNETYNLSVESKDGVPEGLISSGTIWGILRGLESFSQCLFVEKSGNNIFINATIIEDFPRYTHRGLLIDTSRHYLPIKTIKQILDGMEYNKLNVLHWHLTDDESFPYQSKKFPELSDNGAYHSELIYTQNDLRRIIRYATQRGIRVMPEFDTPGHTSSWGKGRPELLTICKYDKGSVQYGPINPIFDFVYSFMQEFFQEVRSIFPDTFLHIGGDEVPFDCWKLNKDISDFMAKMNITGNYLALESYYIERLIQIIDKVRASSVVWQEIFDNGVKLPTSVIVHVWKEPWKLTIYNATRLGYPVLLSTCWYLDHLSTGGDWTKFYTCEPTDFGGTNQQQKLVLGGEACMWGEVVNQYNVVSRIFPRVSAVSEVLWSQKRSSDLKHAARRLEEHTCRMNKRGIPAQPPNGAGFCL